MNIEKDERDQKKENPLESEGEPLLELPKKKKKKKKKGPFVLAVQEINELAEVAKTDCWLAVAELFGSDVVYVMSDEDREDTYQRFFIAALAQALRTLSPNTRLMPIKGVPEFVRDAFLIGLSFAGRKSDIYDFKVIDCGECPEDFFEAEVLKRGAATTEGGNVVITPPTERHPYGAVIVGRGRCWSDTAVEGTVAQPTIPMDASVGRVQHSDEIVCFVGMPEAWKMAVASVRLGLKLLDLLRSQHEKDLPARFGFGLRPLAEAALIPFESRWMTMGCLYHRPEQKEPLLDHIKFTRQQATIGNMPLHLVWESTETAYATSKSWEKAFASELEATEWNTVWLCNCLGIPQDEVLLLPVLLRYTFSPNAVNLLPVPGGVIVPRQHTLRVPLEILRIFLGQFFEDVEFEPSFLDKSQYVQFWVDEEMTVEQIASCFVPEQHVPALVSDIMEFNALQRPEVLPGRFVSIPCVGSLDLFDGYIYQLFRKVGIKVEFLETGCLNRHGGNIHCATNNLPSRVPHEKYLQPLKEIFFDSGAGRPGQELLGKYLDEREPPPFEVEDEKP